MDVNNLLTSAIRLSGFITIRLIFFVAVAVLLAPYFGETVSSLDEPSFSMPILQDLLDQYVRIVEALGIASIAIYLLVFVFFSALHMCFQGAVIIGNWIPPGIDGDKLQLIERRFSKATVETLLAHDEDTAVVARFTQACQDGSATMDQSFAERVIFLGNVFNATKFYLLLFVLCIYIFPSDLQFVDIVENRGLILAALVATLLVLAFMRFDSLRTRYLEFIEELEDCVEKHLRPTVGRDTYATLADIVARFEKSFTCRLDWHMPFFGSLREAVRWMQNNA